MKRFVFALGFLYLVGLATILIAFAQLELVEPDIVVINDIVMSHLQGYSMDQLGNGQLTQAQPGDGIAPADELIDDLTDFFAQASFRLASRDRNLRNTLIIILTLFTTCAATLFAAIDRSILAPFRRLEGFAQSIAAGNLDVPLQMDKAGNFGAFTESFDLMRYELARAREAEIRIDKSKKELVASLSHDIKTPIASIRAVAELMSASGSDAKTQEQLRTITAKADQVDTLITNLFSATLEELHELPVTPTELPSTTVLQLIKNADYRKLATLAPIPQCLLIADEIRLAQVFDNVFENSYKYAGTPIEVKAELVDNTLVLDITDQGTGVPAEELALLTQKFYRATNAEGKSGSGLGLYLSRYFMEKMAGELHCQSSDAGFTVRLILRLA